MLDDYPSCIDAATESLTLYRQIRTGIKISEWREAKHYWFTRLCKEAIKLQKDLKDIVVGHKQQGLELPSYIDLTDKLKVHRAWFTEGNPKRNVPRLETSITGLFFHPKSNQLEIKIADVVEVTE